MARFDLSDTEWSIIVPLLPNKPRGVPRVDDRRVINGIFYILRTAARRGAICLGAMAPIPRSTTATTAGPRRVFGCMCSRR